MAVAGCAAPAPARAPADAPVPEQQDEEIDLTAPAAAREGRPVLPPGLKPCAKDAPPGGEGCVVAREGRGAAPEANDTVHDVPVGPDDPVRGAVDARVTVVVFSDFECPFCRRHADNLERLRSDFPEAVRLVWKDLPLPSHPHSRAAAELARAARAHGGDAAFWKAHDLLFAAQSEFGAPAFRRIASALGLAPGPTLAGMREARHGVVIQAGITLADALRLDATPTSFVNGRKLGGAVPYPVLRSLVERELSGER